MFRDKEDQHDDGAENAPEKRFIIEARQVESFCGKNVKEIISNTDCGWFQKPKTVSQIFVYSMTKMSVHRWPRWKLERKPKPTNRNQMIVTFVSDNRHARIALQDEIMFIRRCCDHWCRVTKAGSWIVNFWQNCANRTVLIHTLRWSSSIQLYRRQLSRWFGLDDRTPSMLQFYFELFLTIFCETPEPQSVGEKRNEKGLSIDFVEHYQKWVVRVSAPNLDIGPSLYLIRRKYDPKCWNLNY